MEVSQPKSRPLAAVDPIQRLVILLLIAVLPLSLWIVGAILFAAIPVLGPVFTAGVSSLAISASIWLMIRQRRVSVWAVLLLCVGAIWIFEASLRDTYNTMILPLPDSIRFNKSISVIENGIWGLDAITQGLLYAGFAWLRFLVWFRNGRGFKQAIQFLNLLMAIAMTLLAGSDMFSAWRNFERLHWW